MTALSGAVRLLALYFVIAQLLLPTSHAQSGLNQLWTSKNSSVRGKAVPSELLVKFRPGKLDKANTLHKRFNARKVRDFDNVKGLQLVRILNNASRSAAIAAYQSDPSVEYAEPNYLVTVSGVPNDPLLNQQWALHNLGGAHSLAGADIHAFEAWTSTVGSPNVVIAVIDTGVDYLHSDLAANIFNNTADCNSNGLDDDGNGYPDDCHGINTYANTSDPMDDYGHGTHVAGIIGAVGNNGVGISGVDWQVKVLPCKFLNEQGYGSVEGAIGCLNYVQKLKQRGVNIVATNNSWGGFENSAALNDAIAAQRDAGILFVVASGNEFSNNDVLPVYPANIELSNVISVASTTSQDRVSDFSNVGRYTVHLGAPGDEILSTLPSNSYGLASGTSMAAPHVSGVIGLLKSKNSALNWKQLKNSLLSGGDSVGSLQDTITGRRLNAAGSLGCSSAMVYSRLKPQGAPISVTVKQPLTISYANVNCASPTGPVQATIAETTETFNLRDDGVAPDQTANDGIWSGNWIPTSIGRYTINVSGGDSFAVEVLTPYVYVGKVSEYREISGTSLDLEDDSVATIDAPFPIRFGGSQFSKLFISSNGTISLSTAFREFYNRYIPMAGPYSSWDGLWLQYQTTTLIAPWWDDLYPIKGTEKNVFWEITGSAPNRELVIEWRNVGVFECHGDAESVLTFEAVFKEQSNDVIFEYKNATMPNCYAHTNGRSATVGVQTSGSEGSQWSYYMPYVQDGNAVRFVLNTESLPQSPVPQISSLTPNQADVAEPGESDLTLVVKGSNFVPGSVVMWDEERLGTTYITPNELHASIIWYQRLQREVSWIKVKNPEPGGGTSNAMPFGTGGEPPYITALIPSSVPAGSADFDLTIKGSGFTSGHGFIWFNNQMRQVTSTAPTEIHAKIYASDVAKAGTYEVFAEGFAGTYSNRINFTVTSTTALQVFDDGHGQSYRNAQRSPMRFLGWTTRQAQSPEYLKWFTRDRTQVESRSTSENADALSASTALPPGTPVPGIRLNPSIPAGFIPTGIVTADFNRDGKVDWIVANGGDNNLYIYLGRGDGTANPATIIPLRGMSPVHIIGADLRKNGRTDLVVAEADSGTVGVFLDKGDGTFEPELLHYAQGPVYSVAIGDFNRDTVPDILYGLDNWVTDPATAALGYFPGIGNGEFKRPVIIAPTSIWAALGYKTTVADLKNNGTSDVIVSDLYQGTFVYENVNGQLKAGQVLGYNIFDYAEYNSAVGDIDEDGCPDVVITTTYGFGRVKFGHCDGTFEARSNLENWGLGESGFSIKLVDVNGDSHLDIVSGGILLGGGAGWGVADGGLVSVSFGNGKGWFDWPRVYPAQQGIFDLAVADLNRDTYPDIITANQDNDSVTVLLNDGKGGFGASVGQYTGYIREGGSGSVNDPLGTPLTFDANGDNRPDVVLFQTRANTDSAYPIAVLLNQGNGQFSNPIRSTVSWTPYIYPTDYAIADFRKTGRLDIFIPVVGINGDGGALFITNQGSGTFAMGGQYTISDSFMRTAVGDFDSDGIPDVVVAGTSGKLTFFHSNGNGTFTQKEAGTLPSGGVAGNVGTMWAPDLNHDGRIDLLVHTTYNVVPYSDHALVSFLGNGDGTFQTARLVIPNLSQPTLADVNGDGWFDIIETSDVFSPTEMYQQIPPRHSVYLGQPDGSFVLNEVYDQYKSGMAFPTWDALSSSKFDSLYADYDGDHSRDIRALMRSPGLKYLQFLKGTSEGKLVPGFTRYVLGATSTGAPLTSADFNGDGRADMLQYNGFTSSFHILPGVLGKKLDARLLVNPVKGPAGTLRVLLAAASTASSQISLSVSDSNIFLPSPVTIPAGSVYLDVPFTIGPGFNRNRQFVITAQLDTATAQAFGTQVPADSALGFSVTTYLSGISGLPGGDSFSNIVNVYSIAGYGGHVKMGCGNLPNGMTCIFANPETELARGTSFQTNVKVRIDASVAPGEYPFEVEVSDGVTKATTPLTITVQDFSLRSDKPYVEVLAGGTGKIPVGVFTYAPLESIVFTCTVANNAGTCTFDRYQNLVTVQADQVALGTYAIQLTGTTGTLVRTADLSMHVVDITATFPSSIELKAGTQSNVVLHLRAPDGLQDGVWIDCTYSEIVSCYVNTTVITFPNGAKSADVTVILSVQYWSSNKNQQRLPSGTPLNLLAIVACVLLPLGMLAIRKGGTVMILTISIALLVSAGATLSCGGGGGGGGGGGTNPPPGSTRTEVLKFTAIGNSFSKELGSITVKVSK
jgi:subtilisin family serine protease